MFMGEYNHTIDAKGRLIIPARFRELLGEEFILTKGLDGCLSIYPMDAWEAFSSDAYRSSCLRLWIFSLFFESTRRTVEMMVKITKIPSETGSQTETFVPGIQNLSARSHSIPALPSPYPARYLINISPWNFFFLV